MTAPLGDYFVDRDQSHCQRRKQKLSAVFMSFIIDAG
jgi:hypothetical protein